MALTIKVSIFLSSTILKITTPAYRGKSLLEALDYAKNFVGIPDKHMEIILHCRKFILYDNSEACVKKTSKDDFDVPQGSFDGDEVSELMELFILNKINKTVHTDNHGR